MRIFENCEFKKECPICKTKKKGNAVLIGIYGTQEGCNIEARLFHVDCMEFLYYEKEGVIAQNLK